MTTKAAELAQVLGTVTSIESDVDTLQSDVTTINTVSLPSKVDETHTGDVDITGELSADVYNENAEAVTSSAGTATFDLSTGNLFTITLSENTTLAFTNPPASGDAVGFTITITQDGSTAYTITYPSSVTFAGGTAPDTPATSEVDVVTLFTSDGGTTYFGFLAGDAMAVPA